MTPDAAELHNRPPSPMTRGKGPTMPDASSNSTTIAVAAIGAISALGAAAFANWDKIVKPAPEPAPVVHAAVAAEPAAPSAIVVPAAQAAPTTQAASATAADGVDEKAPALRLANLLGDWKSSTSPEPVFGMLRLRAEGQLVRFRAVASKACTDAAGCAYATLLDPAQATLHEGRREWQLPRTPLVGASWAPAGTTAVSMTVTRNIAEPRKLYAHVTLYGSATTSYDDVFVRP
jgi:hypothetical protein